ncbi:PAS domain S-box protein [Shivajiella indica]|uniref:histidine kinase n=1 Tax=Shivajiella indica TaxID=872115 RepID=A0ABW5B3T6_9BACT
MKSEKPTSESGVNQVDFLEELLVFQELILTLTTEFIHIQPEAFEHAIAKILRTVGEEIGVDRVYIFIREEQNQYLVNTYEWCRENVSPQIKNLQHIPFELYQPIRDLIQKEGYANIYDISVFSDNRELFKHFYNQDIKSFLMLPLFGGGSKIGLIGFDSVFKKQVFLEKEISLLKVLSNVIGNAIVKNEQEMKIMQSEAEFSNLFESMSQGVIYQDNSGTIIKVNSQVTRLLGLSIHQLNGLEEIPRQWKVIKSDGSVFPDQEFPPTLVLSTGKPQINVEMGIYRPDLKDYVWILVNSVPEFSDDIKKSIRVLTTITDITDKKKEQEITRASEYKFRKLVENLPGAAYLGKFDGNYSNDYISDKVFDILGYTPSEILVDNPSFERLYHPADYLEARRQLKEAINNRKPYQLTYRMRHKNGHWVNIEEFGEGVFENGELLYLIGFFVDISNRRKNEEQIFLHSKLQDLLMKISSTYISVNPELFDDAINNSLAELGRFIQADRFYIFNYDFENLTCSNTHEWCEEGVEPQIKILQDVPLDEIPDWVNTHKNGETLIVYDVDGLEDDSFLKSVLEPQGIKSLITIPLMDDDKCIGFIGLDFVKNKHQYSSLEEDLLKVFAEMLASVKKKFKVSNELMEKQQFLADIIENNESLLYVKNLKGEYLLVNKKWEKTTGVKRAKALGRNDREIFSLKNEKNVRVIEENDELVSKRGKVLYKEEELFIQGERKFYESIKFPFKDKEGNAVGVAGISTEVTNRKIAELSLKESEERFKTIFEKNASPMYLFNPISKRFVDVNQAAESYYGYPKEKFLTLKLEDINVSETDLNAKIKLVRKTKRQRYEFKNRLSDGTIRDVEVFTSVLIIGGTELIHSIVHDITERNDYLKTVENQNRIFQEIAWEQSHVVRAPLARMMGLFAMIDEKDLDTNERKFLRKEILNSANEIDEIIKQISIKTGNLNFHESIHTSFIKNKGNKHTETELLLIDDDLVVQMVHKKMITRNGLHENPKVFISANSALSYIKEKDLPNFGFIVLLDINMPEMNGWEFLDELSKIDLLSHIEVIMLTSSVDQSDRIRAQQNPFVVDYLTKPLNSDTLEILRKKIMLN